MVRMVVVGVVLTKGDRSTITGRCHNHTRQTTRVEVCVCMGLIS